MARPPYGAERSGRRARNGLGRLTGRYRYGRAGTVRAGSAYAVLPSIPHLHEASSRPCPPLRT
ncbi:hypothetical protein T261_3072 [Streptomyces lydicus]|nr:hypothetical protein T261_3072 [Streptomyces lydicus]